MGTSNPICDRISFKLYYGITNKYFLWMIQEGNMWIEQ